MIKHYNKIFFNKHLWLLAIVVNLISWSSLKAQTCTTLYATSFDTTSISPVGATGWTGGTISLTGSMGATASTTYPTGFTPYSGAGMAFSDAYNWSSGAVAYMATPAFDLATSTGASGIGMSFYFLRHSYSTGYAGTIMQVYANTSPNLSGSPVLIGTYNCLATVATANQPTVSTNGWYKYSAPIPNSMRTSSTYIIFKVTGDWWNNLYVDNFELTQYAAQTYQGLTVTQPTTAVMSAGLSNQVMLRIPVATKGLDTSCLEVTNFSFNTSGTALASNISSAKVFYTGSSNTFAAVNQFGSTIVSPSGSFTVSGSKSLLEVGGACSGNDTVNFWLAYDISATATNSVVNGLCTDVTIGGITRIPAVITNPGAGRNIASPLSGVYTIDATGSGARNYTTFAAALTDLNNVGVLGPVTFNVAAGTYTGAITISGTIPGASATNRVVFDGGNGNASTRIITASLSSLPTLVINTSYLTFRNISITNTFSGSCQAVGLRAATAGTNIGNTFSNCIINTPNSGTSTAYGLASTNAANGYGAAANFVDSLTIDSCTLSTAYYTLYLYGASTTAGSGFGANRNFKITNNTISNSGYYSCYLYYIQNPIDFINNKIIGNANTFVGLYMYYCYNHNTGAAPHRINNNQFSAIAYNYIYYTTSTTSNPTQIINNMYYNSRATTNYGFYIYNGTGLSGDYWVYHNTINMSGASGTAYGIYYYNSVGGTNTYFKNNIFAITSSAGSGGYPAYFSTNPSGNVANYNVYYNQFGTNLVYRGTALTAATYLGATAGGDTSWNVNPGFISNLNPRLPDACTAKIGASYILPVVPFDIDGTTRTMPLVGAHEASSLANDMSVTAILSPVPPVTASTYPVKVLLKNTGSNTVSTFDVNYVLNGGTVVTEAYTGSALNACDTVSFTFSVPITLLSTNTFKVYTSNPNLTIDANRNNDTVSTTMNAALAAGNYTIDPSGSGSTNYTSFAAAASALNFGITGPIVFTVAPGTYTSRVIISGPIVGASTANDVVFDGVSAATRIIASSQAAQSVVQFNGSKYVTFKNFTVTNTGTGTATAIGVNSSNITIKNCIINLSATSTTTTSYGVNVSASTTGYGSTGSSFDSIYVDSNTFNGGFYGIYTYGITSGSSNSFGDKYRWNTFNGIYNSGIYHYYANGGVEILNNKINMSTVNTGTQYGIYFYGYNSSSTTPPTPNRFVGNIINNTSYMGMYIYLPYGTTAAPSLIANNLVLGGFRYNTLAYGIYLYNTSNTNVYHNTVNMDHPSLSGNTYSALYSSGSSLVNVKNNIFLVSSTGGTNNCAYFGVSPSGNAVNYNIYFNNSSASNVIYRGAQYSNTTYKTATAGGDSSFYLNPSFVNFATRDFHLTNGCTRGVDLTSVISNDIDGQVRSTSPNVGADEVMMPADNMAVLALTAPGYPVALGTQNVTARVQNLGSTIVSNFNISYTLNGGTPVTEYYATSSLATCDTLSITFATQVSLLLQNNTMRVYTNSPNGLTDGDATNDTITVSVATPMNGTYTIGGASPDFTNFTSATNALRVRGVDGPVVFNVRNGTYNEAISLLGSAIQGVNATNTVIFQSQSGLRDSVTLSNSGTPLSLAGLSYFTFRNMSIKSTLAGINVVNISGINESISLYNCVLSAPLTSATSSTINANGATLRNSTISRNLIYGSYYGVYINSPAANRTFGTVVDSNTISGQYYHPLYIYYTYNFKLRGNTIDLNSGTYTYNYLYLYYCDSAFEVTNNSFLNNKASSYAYIYTQYCTGFDGARGNISRNVFNTNSTSYTYPAFAYYFDVKQDIYNNVMNLGLGYFYYLFYYTTDVKVYHNTINSASSSYSVYMYNISNTGSKFINNVVNNSSTGYAMYWGYAAPSSIATEEMEDYNVYFTAGTNKFYGGSAYTSFTAWRAAANNVSAKRDVNSLFYRIPFTSTAYATMNLEPLASDTASWAIQGHAVHNTVSPVSYNGITRAATIADGTPDVGAYEFTPTSVPPMAIATPSAPTAGTTQVFTFGNDTVCSIVWDAFTTPPTSIAVRQYAGVPPTQTGSVTYAPNFYVNATAPTGTYLYNMNLYYKNIWLGNNPNKVDLIMAKKDVSSAWAAIFGSTIDTTRGISSAQLLTSFSNFTLTDVNSPLPVKLTSFAGKKSSDNALLSWNTASEINSSYFEIQSSIDGKTFKAIGKVKASGNSNKSVNYQFTDMYAFKSAKTVYYRLRMVDADGTFEYSSKIAISSSNAANGTISVYPNPFAKDLTINLASSSATAKVVISDVQGKVVFSQTMDATTGKLQLSQIANMEQGIYFVTVEQNGVSFVEKVVKY